MDSLSGCRNPSKHAWLISLEPKQVRFFTLSISSKRMEHNFVNLLHVARKGMVSAPSVL